MPTQSYIRRRLGRRLNMVHMGCVICGFRHLVAAQRCANRRSDNGPQSHPCPIWRVSHTSAAFYGLSLARFSLVSNAFSADSVHLHRSRINLALVVDEFLPLPQARSLRQTCFYDDRIIIDLLLRLHASFSIRWKLSCLAYPFLQRPSVVLRQIFTLAKYRRRTPQLQSSIIVPFTAVSNIHHFVLAEIALTIARSCRPRELPLHRWGRNYNLARDR